MELPTCTVRPAGRYPRGEETKQRIVDVAIDIFGQHGFVGASTRDIARAAVVNTPTIPYYFGSKSGLYHACVDRLTGRVSRRIHPSLLACQSAVETNEPTDRLISVLNQVQDALIDCFFSDQEGLAIRRLLAWEDVEDGEKRSDQYMKERIGIPILQTFRSVIERVADPSLTDIEIDMHALSLMGLSMIFHFNQSKLIDTLSWSSEDSILETLKTVAYNQLAYALVGLSKRCN